jgi:sigma-B regulation protein RsbU (phosphoserine phosphatase)
VSEAPDPGLLDACAQVEKVMGLPLRVVPDAGEGSAETVPVAVGWSLAGDADRARLEAAAEMILRVARTDEEMQGLCSEIVERYEEVTLVYRISERLGAVLGEHAITRHVLQEAAQVLGAESGTIWLRNDHGELVPAARFPAAGSGPTDAPAEIFSALRDGKPWVSEPSAGEGAAVAVPLPSAEGEPFGLLALWGRSDDRSYRTGEVKLLVAIATLTSAFIRNDRLASGARRAEARKREDEIARQIHRGLLPHHEPRFPGLDIAGECSAAETVGGDYYGYLQLPDGSLGLAMADISGHGVGAALYMAAAKGALQAEARRILSPSDLLHRTNEALVGDFSRSDLFATTFVARFLPGGRSLEYANGGHNPPLLVRADGGVERLDPSGPALGLLRKVGYREESRTLNENDVVVVYTDGLIEARDAGGELYGAQRLEEAATRSRHLDARGILGQLLAEVTEHRGGDPTHDDVTLVVVKAIDELARGSGKGPIE